jgi:hypothetical protein
MTDLNPYRFRIIDLEVADYLAATGYGSDYDHAAITEAVAARADSIDDLTEDEFNAILLASARR